MKLADNVCLIKMYVSTKKNNALKQLLRQNPNPPVNPKVGVRIM